MNKIAGAEDFENVAWVLDEPVKTFSRTVVDDTLKRNVEFQGGAGLQPRVIRTAERKCCQWCSNLAGVYKYPDIPKDVYRRHENCRCSVEYDPGDGKRIQNVHSKKWKSRENSDKIKTRKEMATAKQSSPIDIQSFNKTYPAANDSEKLPNWRYAEISNEKLSGYVLKRIIHQDMIKPLHSEMLWDTQQKLKQN